MFVARAERLAWLKLGGLEEAVKPLCVCPRGERREGKGVGSKSANAVSVLVEGRKRRRRLCKCAVRGVRATIRQSE